MNIQVGKAGGLETALRELHQGNIDVGFLQETKLTQGIHNLRNASKTSGRRRQRVSIRGEYQ